MVAPVVVLVPVLASESALGAAGAGDLILLRRKLLLPLGVGLGDLVGQWFGRFFCQGFVSINRMSDVRESCNCGRGSARRARRPPDSRQDGGATKNRLVRQRLIRPEQQADAGALA